MVEVKLQSNIKTKSYLVRFNQFEFDSLLHFIFELFINNKIEDENINAIIVQKILKLGYNDTSEIPEKTKSRLEKTYYNLLEKHNKSFDEEKQTYLLMEKIVKSNILVTIDNTLVENSWNSIIIGKNSVVSFISTTKLNDIHFKTI